MATAYHHALSSVKKWGGVVEDYMPIHQWFDETKEVLGDFRHRMYRHHTSGVMDCERTFGELKTGYTILLSTGPGEPAKRIPIRWVAEQHVIEDLGKLVTLADWAACLQIQPWMNRSRKLSKELSDACPAIISTSETTEPGLSGSAQ